MAEKLTKLTEDEHIVMLAFGHLDERMWGIEADDAGRAIQLGYARGILAALEAAGRLLPPGGEVSTQWAVRFTELLGHASPYVQPYSSEHVAREYAAADWRPHRTGELVNRRVTTWPDGTELIGPWSPVLSDNTDERPQWAIRDHTGTYGVSTTDERVIRRSWAQGITWWDPDGTYELCRRDGASGPWEVVERHPVVSDGGEKQGAGDDHER